MGVAGRVRPGREVGAARFGDLRREGGDGFVAPAVGAGSRVATFVVVRSRVLGPTRSSGSVPSERRRLRPSQPADFQLSRSLQRSHTQPKLQKPRGLTPVSSVTAS
jgi:hypothetical protein